MFCQEVGDAVTEQLEEEATSLAAHLAAATCRWLLVVAELDRREAWGSWGCRSMAHWLSWRCGIDPRTARAHLVVAHALGSLPLVRAGFAAGELSFSQVRAICRVAEAGDEAALVDLARHSTAAQLERTVGAAVRVVRSGVAEADDDAVLPELHAGVDEGGSWELTVRGLSPEDGAVVEAALRLLVDRNRPGSGPAGPLPATDGDVSVDAAPDPALSLAARRAAALVEMAQVALHADSEDQPVSSGDRYQVLVVADENGCHLDHGRPLADDAGRRLACDASVVLLRTHRGEPLDIGRRTRTVPGSIRRVLERRDGGCRFPACGRRAFTHAHHLVHWTRGGPTSVENLLLLCGRHHHLVHEGGWTISGHPGVDLRFHGPDGRVVQASPPRRAEGPGLDERHRRLGVRIDHTTSVSRWDGTRLDLAEAVDAVLLRRHTG